MDTYLNNRTVLDCVCLCNAFMCIGLMTQVVVLEICVMLLMMNELTLIAYATRVLVYHVSVNVRYWFFIACIVSTPVHCTL